MGFFDDVVNVVSNPVKAVDNAIGTNLSGQGPSNSLIQDASRGDIGSTISQGANGIGHVIQGGIAFQSDLARGDFNGARRSFTRAVGGGVTAANPIVNTDIGNRFYRDKTVNWLTGNIGNDYADTIQGMRRSQDSKMIEDSTSNAALRYGSKAALVGGVYRASSSLYNEYLSASEIVGSSLPDPSKLTWKDWLTGAGIAGAVTSGNFKDAAKKVGVPGDIADRLPDGTKAPDSAPNYGGIGYRGVSNSPSSDQGSYFDGNYSSDANPGSISTSQAALAIGALALAYLIYKKVA